MDRTHLSTSSNFSLASSVHHQEPTSYIPVRVLGKGAFGEAVLYRKTEDNTLVVWKEVFLGRLDAKGRRDAQNEVDILAMLDHPNVVSYYNHFVDGDTLLIEMEYANAGSLYHWLGRRNMGRPGEDGTSTRLLPEVDVLWYLFQLVKGLAYLHGLDILHRDVKTLNIFLTKTSLVKLGDFGIAKILSTTNPQAESCVGTPYYMSPEMMCGGSYDHKSDMWAVGCVLHELLTGGKRTFDASNPLKLSYQIVHGGFEPIDASYSKEMNQLVNSLLSKNTQERLDAHMVIKHPVFLVNGNRCADFEKQITQLHLTNSQSRRPNSGGTEASSVLPIVNSKTTEVFSWGSGRSNPTKLEQFVAERGAVRVAVGPQHMAVISVERELYTWTTLHGQATNTGQLGHGNRASCRNPKRVETLVGVSILDVCCGEEFTACLADDGRVFTCGSNYSSCLGIGGISEVDVPTPLPLFNSDSHRVVRLACGDNHVAVITESGELFTWGSGEFGRLGLNDSETDHGSPQKVTLPLPESLANVFAGPDCTFVLTKAGKVLACGNNEHNKIGFNNAVVGLGKKQREIIYDIPCVHFFSLVKTLSHYSVRFVSSGKTHSAILDTSNQMFIFGSNRYGQLGRGDYKAYGGVLSAPKFLAGKRFSNVGCGDGFTVATTTNNEIYSWGRGDNGQLGVDVGKSGSGIGNMCVPIPKPIFGALHCAADLAVSNWTVLIIAERLLQSRMVQSSSMRFISSSAVTTTSDEMTPSSLEEGSSFAISNNTQNEFLNSKSQKDNTLSTYSGSAVPDWLKDELNNASVIPLYEGNPDHADGNQSPADRERGSLIAENIGDTGEVEASIDCDCGCRDVIAMLHRRIQELESSNGALKNLLDENVKKN